VDYFPSLIKKIIEARDSISSTPTSSQQPSEKQWKRPILLVKISPDLTEDEKALIAQVIVENKLDGLIITNTTTQRPESLKSEYRCEMGGLSGDPLAELSTKTISDLYRLTKGTIPIIGVGGISSGLDAYQKIRNGASLVQLYSSFSFQGPSVVPSVKRELAELLRADGFSSVDQAVGVDVKLS